jgi:hypothetical protein
MRQKLQAEEKYALLRRGESSEGRKKLDHVVF